MTTTSIIKKYKLNAFNADSCESAGHDALKSFFQDIEINWETNEDGVLIHESDDDIFEATQGNYDSVSDITRDADDVYFNAFEEAAKNL